MTEILQRVRFTVDVIVKGDKKMSPSAMRNVGREISTLAHVVAFEGIKSVSVVHTPKEERVVYAHLHNAPNGNYCQERNGCLAMAQDGLSQDLEDM
jgi:hypothetical protein